MESELLKAIDSIRKGRFGGTAIKVELEAQLNRGTGDCDYCEGSGTRYCEYCDEGTVSCGECEGSGETSCSECDGEGNVDVIRENSEGVEFTVNTRCDECDGNGMTTCPDCEEGQVTCSDCDGSYEWDCDDCDGHSSDFSEVTDCHNWFMRKLQAMGLAEEREESQILSHVGETHWFVLPPLTYGEFYRDGSVDSEFTFTLMLQDDNSIFLLEEITELFKEFADEVGNGIDVDRAGMHIAILQSVKGKYPINDKYDEVGFYNFTRSQALLPALFFLASPDGTSREMQFRIPRISNNDKYSAIFYRGCALEFRVFDTCYDRPEQIYDNIIVIANMLKYWTDEAKSTGLERYAKGLRFGNDESRDVKRFFRTTEQLDWLNAGLRQLRPKYLKISDIKATRKFDVSKKQILNEEKKIFQKEIETYHIYYDEYMYQLEIQKKYAEYNAYDRCRSIEDAQRKAKIDIKVTEMEKMRSLKNPMTYAEEKLNYYKSEISGRYSLIA